MDEYCNITITTITVIFLDDELSILRIGGALDSNPDENIGHSYRRYLGSFQVTTGTTP